MIFDCICILSVGNSCVVFNLALLPAGLLMRPEPLVNVNELDGCYRDSGADLDRNSSDLKSF